MCNKHYYRSRKYGSPVEPSHLLIPFTGHDPVKHFWSKVALTADDSRCWEWQGTILSHGYGRLRFNSKPMSAHRVVWFLTYGVMPSDDLLVRHSCDNRKCVNPKHLSLGTHKDNAQDMVSRNRQRRGAQIHSTKLTEAQVKVIKVMLRDRVHQRPIAKQFGVSQHTIAQIHQGKTWVWVTTDGAQAPYISQ